MATTEPIRNKQQITALTNYYLEKGELRNHVLVMLGIHTALRISDTLRLNWGDVYDFKRKRVQKSISITEKKTGKKNTLALNKHVVRALQNYAKSLDNIHAEMPIILNKRTGDAICRVQAYRLIRSAAESLQLDTRVSCHSLRKTFGYHAWKRGVSPTVIMEIFNHSSLAVTKRYLGVSQDDKNAVYLGMCYVG